MNCVRISDREIGDGNPVYIVFEAGPTHCGFDSAKRLVRLAAAAGGDAVKFQILDAERLMADKSVPFSYQVLADKHTGRVEAVQEPLYDILLRRSLRPSEWRELKKIADDCGITFFSTALFPEEIDFALDMGCQTVKIASGDVNHFPLLRKAARSGLVVQIDTGSAAIGEVEAAVDVLRAEGCSQLIIHHCPSGYPARHDGVNLRIISSLKSLFSLPVAFSDHSPGWEMDIAAVAIGANMVEKTITEDRSTKSVEHLMSLEPYEMRRFVESIRNLEMALGQPRKVMTPQEKEGRRIVRRSAYLTSPGKRGQKLSDLLLDYKRPAGGIDSAQVELLSDWRLVSDLPSGYRLSLADLGPG